MSDQDRRAARRGCARSPFSCPAPGPPMVMLMAPSAARMGIDTTRGDRNDEHAAAPLSVSVTPSECTGNVIPATTATYAGVDYTDMAAQGFRGPGNSVSTSVIEAVVRFPDAAAAKRFLNDQYAEDRKRVV